MPSTSLRALRVPRRRRAIGFFVSIADAMMIDKCRFAPRGDDCAVRCISLTKRRKRYYEESCAKLPQRSRQAKRSDRNGPIQWPIR